MNRMQSPIPSQRPLRLGIDAEALRKPLSGIGQYVFNLCQELEALLPDAQFFAYGRLPAERLALPSSRWVLRAEAAGWARKLPSFLWLKTRGRAMCLADGLDVFWAGRTLHPRLPAAVRTVCTVHDLNHKLVPQTMERPTRWSHQWWFDGDVAGARVVLANSQGTTQRVRSLLGLQVHGVVAPGLAPGFCPWQDVPQATAAQASGLQALAGLGIKPPYLLAVSTLEPRKNVRALFEAFMAMKAAGELAPAYQLVLVGARGWQDAALGEQLAAASPQGVLLPGYVPDALMPALYRCADALVMPSLYEGFGMPALEARACGTRVVVSDLPELREAAGPQATVVQPTVDGVRNGIRQALAMAPQSEKDLAQRLSWRASAQGLLPWLQGASLTDKGS